MRSFRRVRVYPADEVTSRAPGEEEPRAAGLDRAGVDAIWSSVARLYGTGLHPAVALCLRRQGRVVIDRVTGRDIRAFLRDEVLRPIGLRHLGYGVAPDEVAEVAENAFTGPAPFPPYSWLLRRALGVSIARAVQLSNHPRFLTATI